MQFTANKDLRLLICGLLSLQEFVSLVRGRRREQLKRVCVEEWLAFEKRIRRGDVNDAVVSLIDKMQSKL